MDISWDSSSRFRAAADPHLATGEEHGTSNENGRTSRSNRAAAARADDNHNHRPHGERRADVRHDFWHDIRPPNWNAGGQYLPRLDCMLRRSASVGTT